MTANGEQYYTKINILMRNNSQTYNENKTSYLCYPTNSDNSPTMGSAIEAVSILSSQLSYSSLADCSQFIGIPTLLTTLKWWKSSTAMSTLKWVIEYLYDNRQKVFIFFPKLPECHVRPFISVYLFTT